MVLTVLEKSPTHRGSRIAPGFLVSSYHLVWQLSVAVCHQQKRQWHGGVSCGFGAFVVTSESLKSVYDVKWYNFS